MDEKAIVSNINEFITVTKIKKSAIVKRSGINKDKLSRILNKKQPPTIPDLKDIAKTLGHSIEFFMTDFQVKIISPSLDSLPQPAFYMGEVTEERKEQSHLYSELAERIHYLKTMATITATVSSDF